MPSANTLVRWVNENAFASIVQARPCPTFGRPVHLRGSPHRLQPGTSPHALRIPSHDGHPALRKQGGFRSALACFRLSLSCPFRLLHTFPFSGQRRITPAFGYSAPHSSARGTLTLLSNALLSTHYGVVRLLWCVPVGVAAYCLFRPVSSLIGSRSSRDLPVLVHVVSQRARVLRLRRANQPLASSATVRIAFPLGEKVGVPDLSFFEAQ